MWSKINYLFLTGLFLSTINFVVYCIIYIIFRNSVLSSLFKYIVYMWIIGILLTIFAIMISLNLVSSWAFRFITLLLIVIASYFTSKLARLVKLYQLSIKYSKVQKLTFTNLIIWFIVMMIGCILEIINLM